MAKERRITIQGLKGKYRLKGWAIDGILLSWAEDKEGLFLHAICSKNEKPIGILFGKKCLRKIGVLKFPLMPGNRRHPHGVSRLNSA